MRRVRATVAACVLSIGFAASIWGWAFGDPGTDEPDRASCSEEEFEILERLRECPLDIADAAVDDFLAIPGFPADLAAKIVASREEGTAAAVWLRSLTPLELERLYRFEEFCLLPGRSPLRLKARISAERFGSAGLERRQGFISCSGDGYRGAAGWRSHTGKNAVSAYVSKRLLEGRIVLHGGDFVPDIAMGLLFDGSFTYYPFSSGYPFRRYRAVAARTSLYAEALRGIAVESFEGGAHLLVFAGKPRSLRGDRFHLGEQPLYGMRICRRGARWEMGGSLCRDPGRDGGSMAGADCRCRLGSLTVGGEISCTGTGSVSGVWGALLRGGAFDVGILMHDVSFSHAARFGTAAGRMSDTDEAHRGCSLVVGRRCARGVRIRAAFERMSVRECLGERERTSIRVELERLRRPIRVRFSLLSRMDRERSGLFLPDSYVEDDLLRRVKMSAEWRPASLVVVGTTVQYVDGGRGSGSCMAPSIRLVGPSGSIDWLLKAAVYDSDSGRAVFCVYEPALEGGYPWKQLYGRGTAWVFRSRVTLGHVRFSWRLCGDDDGRLEGNVQVRLKI